MVVSDYDYDSLNRLVSLKEFNDANGNRVWDSGENLLAQFTYDLLADGKRRRVTEIDDANRTTTVDWFYDNLGRLTREVFDSQYSDGDTIDYVNDYTYDLVGNRKTKTADTDPTFATNPTHDQMGGYVASRNELFSYDYDANDRLMREVKDVQGTTAGDETTFYQYGGSASPHTVQTAKTTYAGVLTEPTGPKTAETIYTYNLQGRMSQSSVDKDGAGSGAAVVTLYSYDADGIRVSQTAGGVETTYLNDKQNPTGYSQVLEESNAGTLAKTYTLGLDVIAQDNAPTPNEASPGVKFLLYDGHGSTRSLVDAFGQPLTGQIFRYDAFGNRLDDVVALTTLLYSGEQTDATGLQYLRARYYNPNTGWFNTLDPFAGSMNDPLTLHKYLYCHGDGINYVDPTGECELVGMLSVSSISSQLRSMQMPTFAGALESASALAGSAGSWMAQNAATAALRLFLPTGFTQAFTSVSLGAWFEATALQFTLRWTLGLGQGLLVNSVIRENLDPVIGELGAIAQLAKKFNGHLGGIAGAGVAEIAGWAAGRISNAEQRIIANNTGERPLRGAAFGLGINLAILYDNAMDLYSSLAAVNSAITGMFLSAYQRIPNSMRTAMKTALGQAINHPEGIQSIEVRPRFGGMLWDAALGDLHPEAELRSVRLILTGLDQGGIQQPMADFLSLIRRLKEKYGEIVINGTPQ